MRAKDGGGGREKCANSEKKDSVMTVSNLRLLNKNGHEEMISILRRESVSTKALVENTKMKRFYTII